MAILCDNDLFGYLKIFLEFTCEEKVYPIDDVIEASTVLLKSCPASRSSVFKFYNQLFSEYCYEYCVSRIKKSDSNVSIDDKMLQKTILLWRFAQALNLNKQNTAESKSMNETLPDIKVEDCPQSPTKEISDDFDMEDLSNSVSLKFEDYLTSVINSLDKHMLKLGDILEYLLANDTDVIFTISIFDWALDLAMAISSEYQQFVVLKSIQNQVNVENQFLMNSLKFWINCPVMQVLTKILFDCLEKTDAKTLIVRLLKNSPHSDWILAYLFNNLSHSEHLTKYIEHLISNSSSYSTIFILSYISEHNPHAIVKCSKSNLPFLLKLCSNSKTLLDLLANDLVNKVDIESLNKFAESHALNEMNENIIYCILNAPNAFELLKISFDLTVHPKATEILCNRILSILSLVVFEIYNFIYDSVNSSRDAYSMLLLIRDNVKQLISHSSIPKSNSLKKIQLRLLNLVCIFSGIEFITEVFHHLLNASSQSIDISNYENPKSGSLLLPLFNSLKLHVGYEIQNCFKNTLKLNYLKKLNFWAVLMSFVEAKHIELDIDDLIYHLKAKSFDKKENILKKFFILKIIMKIFERDKKLYYRQQYKLCYTLVTLYFELIQMLNNYDNNNDRFLTITTNTIVITQNLLFNLANNFYINEYVICKSLLDFIVENCDLFCEVFYEQVTNSDRNSICLNQEMFYFENNLKFKKNSLLPYHKKRKLICSKNKYYIFNKQLVIDLLQRCVKDKEFFAKLFVDCFSSEPVYNNAPWLDEDPKDGQIQHVRMTLENDLNILKLFEVNPILWNIFEIFSNWKQLKHCMIIIRAIINAQRTNLASSSMNDKNIFITQKLISMICNDEILPVKPFIYINELIPRVSNLDNCFILHDIAKFIRNNTNPEISSKQPIKSYLDRLRIILANKQPDELFIKIFKSV